MAPSSVGMGFTSSDTISWALIHDKILNQCLGCHSGLVAPDLTTYSGAVASIGLVQSATTAGLMPPSAQGYAPLDTCSQAIINSWVNLGTPQNSSTLVTSLTECQNVALPSGGGTTDPNEVVSWDSLNKRLFVTCSICHGTKYSTLAKVKSDIKNIYSAINTDYMPQGSPASACTKAILKSWMDNAEPTTTTLLVSSLAACK